MANTDSAARLQAQHLEASVRLFPQLRLELAAQLLPLAPVLLELLDLALVDIQMPQLDGFEIASILSQTVRPGHHGR